MTSEALLTILAAALAFPMLLGVMWQRMRPRPVRVRAR